MIMLNLLMLILRMFMTPFEVVSFKGSQSGVPVYHNEQMQQKVYTVYIQVIKDLDQLHGSL